MNGEDLVALADAPPGPTVSITLPTHRRGAEVRQGPIRLRTLAARARSALVDDGQLPAERADALLGPVSSLAEDHRFWQHQDRGLALYATAAGLQRVRTSIPLPERVVVGDGPFLTPLLPLVEPDPPCLVVTVTEGEVKLYTASRDGLAGIGTAHDEHDLPRDAAEVLGPPDPENSVQAPPAARPRAGSPDVARAQAYGETPAERRTRGRAELARRVAAAVQRITSATGHPVVVVADPKAGGHVTGPLRESGVDVLGSIELNPTGTTDHDLHTRVSALLEGRLDRRREDALTLFAALRQRGDDRALDAPADVLRAAHEGRVGTLFVASGCEVFGRYDPATGEVSTGENLATAGGDLLGVAAARTIAHGGTVHVVERHRLSAPTGVVLRF